MQYKNWVESCKYENISNYLTVLYVEKQLFQNSQMFHTTAVVVHSQRNKIMRNILKMEPKEIVKKKGKYIAMNFILFAFLYFFSIL